jgi:lipopolysaccharide transport system ATP-binding protein
LGVGARNYFSGGPSVNQDVLIKCESLGKKFCINQRKSMLYGGVDVFASMVGFPTRRDTLRNHEIWALRDLNFEVKRGETLGVIGINGAGKSTLLRVLSGIYPPDAGTVSIKGPVGALIAAGAGFHPDMTGRENIYLNGAIVGLRKREIDLQLEEIIEFAEIGEFIDTAVRFYSTGMYVRLGFSIAVHIRPRVLLLDEILSVGDRTFQNKCFRKLKELRESVEAVLFVSHNLDHVRNLCSKLIILESGRIIFEGDVEEGAVYYQSQTDAIRKKVGEKENALTAHSGYSRFDSSGVRLDGIEIGSAKENFNGIISSGDDIVVRCNFTTEREIANPQFSMGILDDMNTHVIWQRDYDRKIRFDALQPGKYNLTVAFSRPPLVPGVYKVNFGILDSNSCEILMAHKQFAPFVIQGNEISRAIVHCESNWGLERIAEPQ